MPTTLCLALAGIVAPADPPQRVAIHVSVSGYRSARLALLRFAERDATELARVLRSFGHDSRVLLDSGEHKDQVTKANIETVSPIRTNR